MALAHFLRHDRRGDDRLLLLNLDLQPADIFLQLSDQPILFVGQLRQLDLSGEVLEIGLEFRLVVPPCHPVHAGSGLALEREERRPECVDVEMVEKRGEPLLLPVPCGDARIGLSAELRERLLAAVGASKALRLSLPGTMPKRCIARSITRKSCACQPGIIPATCFS